MSDLAQARVKRIKTPRGAQPKTGSGRRQAEMRAITTSVLQAIKQADVCTPFVWQVSWLAGNGANIRAIASSSSSRNEMPLRVGDDS
jgi:hypothetical protein